MSPRPPPGAHAHPRPGRATRTGSPPRSPRTSTRWASSTARTGWATSSAACRATRRGLRSWSSRTWTSWASSCARSRPPASSAWSARAACRNARCRRRPSLLCTESGRPARRHLQQEPPRHVARGEVPGRALPKLAVDAGFASKAEAEAAGVRIGTPVVYLPRGPRAGWRTRRWAPPWTTGPAAPRSSRWRAARLGKPGPTLHLVWSVQEEHNLRGVLPAATALGPDIAHLASTRCSPATRPRWPIAATSTLGGGPVMSLFSFHGRGTLNGVIPHPALVRLMESAAGATRACPSSARRTRACSRTSATSSSWVPQGVACLDLGVPVRYSHSALEVVDPRDVDGLVTLLDAALDRITPDLELVPRAVSHTLGVDIGTFESKGVIADAGGRRSSPPPRGRTGCSCRSPAGRSIGAEEDWWGDLVAIVARAAGDLRASTRVPSTRSPRAPSGPACCRSTRPASRS